MTLAVLKCYVVMTYGPTCLYACLTMSGHASHEMTDGVLRYLLPDPEQGITEFLDSLEMQTGIII